MVEQRSVNIRSKDQDGVLGLDYHYGRQRRHSFKYRLWRRGKEVSRAMQSHQPHAINLLDVGVADGLMIPVLQEAWPGLKIIGLELSWELLRLGDSMRFVPLLADATELPFADESFDVVSAAAVIEHINQPLKMLRDVYRVLRPGGICIVTTPNPLFEWIAARVGRLPEDQHRYTFSLPFLRRVMEQGGFEVIEAEPFMISPAGLPYEDRIEMLFRRLGLGRLLLNQIMVGRHV
ncbi:MAG TPA: class I SAM-dependent methyltransferase [Anaerolineae bacterium]|nr:class I SAM-dependent methyltransferase [Anaerolineae bacterium]HQH39359.1 class I SAM-dependent methyltransferase [Anaerolineae bacterium]